MTGPALSDRTRRILATLVRAYIETGEPVASATLAHKAGLKEGAMVADEINANVITANRELARILEHLPSEGNDRG